MSKEQLKNIKMKSLSILTLLVLTSFTGFCKTWTIVNNGMSFSPSNLTIAFGDSVNFDISASHNAVEVSQSTYDGNGSTALLNGFQVPFNGGKVMPGKLGIGAHYYVCTPHAAAGMKATITVTSTTNIKESKLVANISIFPNPTNDLITIKGDKTISGELYTVKDQFGKQVLSGKLSNATTTVDIRQLATGIYFFQIGEHKRETFKVVKK
tara:strand:+ start:518 stop:1147 length:630 start_codon:yes stop_codon:yes gene_type:complete